MKLRKGDDVQVIRGRDRGKTGKVEKILPKENMLKVAGVNIYKKHVKSRQGQKGGIIEIAKPISTFQVKLVCPNCNKLARIGYQTTSGRKERVCKKCGTTLDKEVIRDRKKE